MELQMNVHGNEGVEVDSISLEMDELTIQEIENARLILKSNPLLTSVNIEGQRVANTMTQYLGAVEKEERTTVDSGSCFHFRTDTHRIIIYSGGSAYFRAYGKYDGYAFFEGELAI